MLALPFQTCLVKEYLRFRFTQNAFMYIYRKTAGASCPCSSQRIWNMWIMKEAQCLRDSAFSFCKARSKGHHIYESGSIETLIRIVDENSGFTIIPEMHLEFLNEAQRKNVRKIEGDYLSQRRISLYIREDYIKERMLNTIINSMKEFMPAQMMNEGNWKYGIRL